MTFDDSIEFGASVYIDLSPEAGMPNKDMEPTP